MSQSADERASEFYALTYDASVRDWPGEIDFYREMARTNGQSVLEVACGTGRVAIRLAQDGANVAGLDWSHSMLEVARQKSVGTANARWVHADMRSFELGESFGLAIIPGHAFQNLNTSQDQVACLECIKRHLRPGGLLVVHLDHQDMGWLGDLVRDKGGVFDPAEEFEHPRTGRRVRTRRAWSYERATQTATARTAWEEIDADGQVVQRWQKSPVRIHCVFRFEMEHLLARVGFAIEAVYGDFRKHPLDESSRDMVWLARTPAPG